MIMAYIMMKFMICHRRLNKSLFGGLLANYIGYMRIMVISL